GMTERDCSLDTLLAARARMREELPRRLTDSHKRFLSGLVRAEPEWSLLQCQHAAQLPALRWKLANLETFRKRRPDDFNAQAAALDAGLGQA
ncbi:MAG TPA: nucleotidyl transferase AbiEii/AbiGii toxin family protein, partial [Ramlibacter sp.]|nr:nucleotidyl transferase AbiEii/AbiGii toxin family protein [Ramlibacter sp.]